MADVNEKNTDQHPENIPTQMLQTTIIATNEVEGENNKTGDVENKYRSQIDNPQPFIVKIDKSKGWSNAEKISLVGIILSGSLFFITLKSFQKTKKSVEISEAALNDSRINQRRRDSLDSIRGIRDYIRDTTNTGLTRQTLATQESAIKSGDSLNKKTIALAQQSLNEQINSLNENRKQFELEGRAFLMVSNITIDTNKLKEPFTIDFKAINMGKFPAKIVFKRFAIAITDKINSIENAKEIIERNGAWVMTTVNEIVSSDTWVGYKQTARALTTNEEFLFKEGNSAIFLFTEFKYISLGVEKTYSFKYSVKITRNKSFNLISYEALEYSDTLIDK